jgi:hypothetical protein
MTTLKPKNSDFDGQVSAGSTYLLRITRPALTPDALSPPSPPPHLLLLLPYLFTYTITPQEDPFLVGPAISVWQNAAGDGSNWTDFICKEPWYKVRGRTYILS